MGYLTTQNTLLSSAQSYRTRVCEDPGYVMDSQALAYLNFGLLQTLCKLGTSRERICSAMNLSYSDFDYLMELTAIQCQQRGCRD